MTAGVMSSQEACSSSINALSLGSTYALLALGLAMVFSILGLVNFAHGELVTVAAYTIYLLSDYDVPFPSRSSRPCSPRRVAAVLMERIAFRPLRGASFVTLLFASFARQRDHPEPLPRARLAAPEGRADARTCSTSAALRRHVLDRLAADHHDGHLPASLVVLTLFLRRSMQGLGMLAAARTSPSRA